MLSCASHPLDMMGVWWSRVDNLPSDIRVIFVGRRWGVKCVSEEVLCSDVSDIAIMDDVDAELEDALSPSIKLTVCSYVCECILYHFPLFPF